MSTTTAVAAVAYPLSSGAPDTFTTDPSGHFIEPARAPASMPVASLAPMKARVMPIQVMAALAWAGDIAMVIAAAFLLQVLRPGHDLGALLPFALVCYTGGARITGVYDPDGLLYLKRSWPRAANVWLCTMLSIAALSGGLGAAEVMPLPAVAGWFLLGAAGIAVSRTLSVFLTRWLKDRRAFDVPTAIVGTGPQAVDLVTHFAQHRDLTTALVGFFDDDAPARGDLPLPYGGNITALIAAIRAGIVTKVFVALPWSDEARLRAVVEALSTTPVEIRLGPDRAGFAYAARPVSSMAGLSIITLLEQPLTGPQQIAKGLEDFIIASVAIVFLAPLMLLIALAVKLTSRGPVLFRQQREGFNCSTFNVLKFRTMYQNSSAVVDVIQASRGDPRVTPVGRFLRRTSLDELPQLFNVLAGHMSLVGPRPHAATTRAGGRLFGDIGPTYAARHKVKPGLTGWAQVSGWRGETTTEHDLIRRLEHDLYYVEHWSIWFDLYILARTGVIVWTQRNAY